MLLIFEIAQMHTDECVREREKEHRNVEDNVCVCFVLVLLLLVCKCSRLGRKCVPVVVVCCQFIIQ